MNHDSISNWKVEISGVLDQKMMISLHENLQDATS